MNRPQDDLRRRVPPIHQLLAMSELQPLIERHGRAAVRDWIRREAELLRTRLQTGGEFEADEMAAELVERVRRRAAEHRESPARRVINASGVILHTGLGRAPLAAEAVDALQEAAGATNVELDLPSGKRCRRGEQLQPMWRQLTGCEDALVVNNNAAATLLVLQALCAGREVLISRGQLIEIGGSFRLPDIFAASGARLKEVGTTNRTRLSDYAAAIGPETAAILRVHPSNYRIVGFAESPEIDALSRLAHERGLLAIDDIGSGSLVDVAQWGLPHEPTFPGSLKAGADLALGSGDKLLGGPQAGVILGRRNLIEQLRVHPLARALRIDKLTLAALAATLQLYLRDETGRDVPVLRLLRAPVEELQQRARAALQQLTTPPGWELAVETDVATVGGGALPDVELPTAVLMMRNTAWSAEELARRLRTAPLPVVGRIRRDRVLLDFRSVLPEEDARLVDALKALWECAGDDAGMELNSPSATSPQSR